MQRSRGPCASSGAGWVSRSRLPARHVFAGALAPAAALALVTALVSPRALAAQVPAPSASRLLELVEQRAVPDDRLRTGAGTAWLLGELVRQACAESSARQWLPQSCGMMPEQPQPLVELRRRLVMDVAHLARQTGSRSEPTQDTLRLVSALLDTAFEALDLSTLAENMARTTSLPPALAPVAPPAPPDPVALAARLLGRLLADGPDLDRPAEHYQGVIEVVLAESGRMAPGQPLSPIQAEATRRLVAEINASRALSRKLAASPTDPALMRELVLGMVRIIEGAMTLAHARPYQLPAAVFTAIEALLGGQLVEAARGFGSLGPPGASPPPEVLKAIELALDFLRAPDDDARRRVLRALLLELPPWTEPWLFDVNIGAMALGASDFRFAGDLTLGYNAGAWGLGAQGYLRQYGLTSTDDTFAGGGTVEAWYSGGGQGSWRWEARLVGGSRLYDTQTTRGPSDVTWLEQTSILAQASLLGGIRYQAPSFAAGAWLGGGGQYEWYDPLALDADTAISLSDHEDLQMQGSGRLRVQWEFWPAWLVARLRVNGAAFRLTRAQTTLVADPNGDITISAAEATRTQIEVSTRLFLDAEFARVLGFVPGLNGGLDYVRVAGGGVVEKKALPVVSAGVRRDVF
ncbi:MAG: hypothetical protein JW940_17945 [Polyangiaceae bacterium]|nr:hypothetical protein [Polyangiaceae bacterium]